MIFFRGLLILFLVFAAKNVMADNHSKTQQEIVDQAKEITKSLEDPKGICITLFTGKVQIMTTSMINVKI